VLKNKLGNKQVIAEDLGFMTDSVRRLVKKTKYPNMKIIMFAFDIEGDSEHMPHNYEHNCVVYTGTHDNDTLVHWYQTLKRQEKAFVKDYLGIKKGAKVTEVADGIIRAAYASVADTAIIPMQDVLSLGGETRMNVPSTLGTNWKWRLRKDSLTPELAVKMRRQATV
jgi:4-alpha-glucanotransferase